MPCAAQIPTAETAARHVLTCLFVDDCTQSASTNLAEDILVNITKPQCDTRQTRAFIILHYFIFYFITLKVITYRILYLKVNDEFNMLCINNINRAQSCSGFSAGYKYKYSATVSYTHLDVYKRQMLYSVLLMMICHTVKQIRKVSDRKGRTQVNCHTTTAQDYWYVLTNIKVKTLFV